MKKPCSNCPFLADKPFRGLTRERAREIAEALYRDSSFHCHKTINYSNDDGGRVTQKSKLCVGAAIFLENTRPGGMRANLAFRLGVMCGEIDPKQVTGNVYTNARDFIDGASS